MSALIPRTIATTTIPTTDDVVDSSHDYARPKGPIAVSEDNVYIVWRTDKGTRYSNAEILFRVSNDSGQTFTDKTEQL